MPEALTLTITLSTILSAVLMSTLGKESPDSVNSQSPSHRARGLTLGPWPPALPPSLVSLTSVATMPSANTLGIGNLQRCFANAHRPSLPSLQAVFEASSEDFTQ
ncbi:hypothetical protein C8F01DRAFT_1136187 [Mycena amicta]|nr:hypothetical protein C8F01DRAFT_1136187 [Mycena amicta]